MTFPLPSNSFTSEAMNHQVIVHKNEYFTVVLCKEISKNNFHNGNGEIDK